MACFTKNVLEPLVLFLGCLQLVSCKDALGLVEDSGGAYTGQFIVEKKCISFFRRVNLLRLVCFALWVMEAAQASAGMSGTFIGSYSVQSINHITILSGVLFGVFLVWLLSRVPSQSLEDKALNLHEKRQNFVTKLTNMLYKRTELLVTAVNLNC
ncbi:hypothetical protein WN944_018629 [Citrus x changshan-huyou]|uniref:Uncharacterized protein n=1 Tax=Citrus x changshan-huyou TaxID=2935761 RepID=A0AAP0LTS6_9ROSI